MGSRVTIDPITRLEGHGKIDIFLNDAGERRPGLLPGAGTAGVREIRRGPAGGRHAADHLAHLRRMSDGSPHGRHQGPGRSVSGRADTHGRRSANSSTTRSCSRITRCTSTSWAGPISSSVPTPPKAERNVLGVIGKVGVDVGKKVIAMRKAARDLITAHRRQGHPSRARSSRWCCQARDSRRSGSAPR